MEKRNYNYKTVENKSGEFSLKIRNKKLAKQLDIICFIQDINKSKFCLEAIENVVNEEYKKINKLLNKEGEK